MRGGCFRHIACEIAAARSRLPGLVASWHGRTPGRQDAARQAQSLPTGKLAGLNINRVRDENCAMNITQKI